MTYTEALDAVEQYRKAAAPIIKPVCNMCPECNGKGCTGRAYNDMGLGAMGNNGTFIRNREELRAISILFDPIHQEISPDTTLEVFGKRFKVPVFAAPLGVLLTKVGIESPVHNVNDLYAKELATGCFETGCFACFGDNKREGYFEGQIASVPELQGIGIPTIKPWTDRRQIYKRLDSAKKAGVMAIATDVDAVGLAYQYSTPVPGVQSLSCEELREFVRAAEGTPVIVKGILSVEAAKKAVDAGVHGILVSNHGGNISESAAATCSVLPAIRKALGEDQLILVDGGVRTGEDVFKMLALGADLVGLGRPFLQAVYGGGREAVYALVEMLRYQLMNTMRLTNTKDLKEISIDNLLH